MRVLLIVAAILLLMALGGWIVFNRSDSSASVELKTEQIQEDTSEAVRNTREWLEDAGDELRQALPDAEPTPDPAPNLKPDPIPR
jgi:Flp pilus assembly protein TadB